MNISLIGFTDRGKGLCANIAAGLEKSPGYNCSINANEKTPLKQWVKNAFSGSDALVFVGACGIAVRAVAPFLQDKATDPAVVVVDEKGRWSISLVSGHLGGANRLAEEIALIVGGEPVITTATDVNGVFAVDVWAKEQNLSIRSMKKAKEVSAALLAGKTVGLLSSYKIMGDIPLGLSPAPGLPLSIRISPYVREAGIADGGRDDIDDGTLDSSELHLVPKSLVLGVGCRKGVSADTIGRVVLRVLAENNIDPGSIAFLASIDLKKEEPGLVSFCEKRGWPLRTYSAEQLEEAQGEFANSPFVSSVTGTGNVCERAAVLGSQGGCLVVKKTCSDGVTVAAAEMDYIIRF